MDCTASRFTLAASQSNCFGYRMDPVERMLRNAERFKLRGSYLVVSVNRRYAGLVPNTVTCCSATSSQNVSGPLSGPSYTSTSAPLAKADSCQFHIIQPHEV